MTATDVKRLSMEEFMKHCLEEATKDLSPQDKADVETWFKGRLPSGFYDRISRDAHSAILQLCSWGLG